MVTVSASGAEPRPALPRWSSTSHGSASTSSLFSDDEDAITPCPPQTQTECSQQEGALDEQHDAPPAAARRGRPAAQRRDSWRSSVVMHMHAQGDSEPCTLISVDAQTLWRRMLAVQRVFGCYHSARMDAALDTGEEGAAPSKTCLDLLNDSIDELPEESRRQLEAYLEHGGTVPSGRRGWRERLMSLRALR